MEGVEGEGAVCAACHWVSPPGDLDLAVPLMVQLMGHTTAAVTSSCVFVGYA